jgi:fructose-specific phosphotransferase system IIC component
MVASVIAMLGGVGDHASHGGPIVLPVVDHKLAYVVAILSGTMVTALCVIVVKSISRHKAPESKP